MFTNLGPKVILHSISEVGAPVRFSGITTHVKRGNKGILWLHAMSTLFLSHFLNVFI